MEVFSARGNPLGGSVPDTQDHQDPYHVLTSGTFPFISVNWASGIFCGMRPNDVECFYDWIRMALKAPCYVIFIFMPTNSVESFQQTCLVVLTSKRTTIYPGGIPPFLGNITSMEMFSAKGNPLGGSIPDTLGRWKSLTRFTVGGCNLFRKWVISYESCVPSVKGGYEINGVLPPSISNCSKLYYLEMGNNRFSGKLNIDFSLLRDINIIRLHYNNFHGLGEADDMRFIDSLINCTKLVRLSLLNCNLIGVLPISIGRNQFKGKIPTTIGKLQKLQVLGLHSNQFSGPIPDAIGSLSLLTKLYLYSNELEGHIPLSLGKCKELNRLELAENRLGGNIPKQLLQLPSLTITLNLFAQPLVRDKSSLGGLSGLDLSYNNLSGNITSSLGECSSLTLLILGGNMFQGVIPSTFSSLGGLEVLDISQNNLSGKIPQFLDKWESLEYLNLSFNDFEGEVPAAGVFANTSAYSVLGNNRLCGGLVTLQLPKCKKTGSKKKWFPFFILVIVIAPTLLIVLCCAYLLCKKKRNSQPSRSSGSERFMKVSYNQLLKATDGFSAANLIGEGEFSSVYKGILDSDDAKSVAIKVLHLQYRGAHRSFLAECEAWRNIRHRNLLKIITSCSSVDFQGNDFKALVYEFMPSGSGLHNLIILRNRAIQRLFSTVTLSLSNILLDADMVAHVGDFGLARLLGTDLNQNSSTGVKGTIGYAPPEYGLGSEMTSSGDVYSFGILLLEVLTGKRPTDDMFNEGLSLHKFAYMSLPDHVIDVIDDDAIVLQSTEANAKKVEECLVATIKIGVSCSVDSPADRMKIEIVVNELQRILHVLQNI
ncbi:leucine-rich repeat protein [Tanacetum coccineum]